MTLQEKEELIKEMEAYAKKVSFDKIEAQKFIDSTEIFTKDGKLTDAYK